MSVYSLRLMSLLQAKHGVTNQELINAKQPSPLEYDHTVDMSTLLSCLMSTLDMGGID